MPRGGSKKGEHRGNAKPRHGAAPTPNEIMRSAVSRPRKPGSQKGRAQLATIEQDLQVSQVIHGRKSAWDLSPKEIVLENMHTFQQAAYTSEAMVKMLLQTSPSESRSRDISALQMDAERLRRVASDEAHKVMQFVHPRYAAIAISGGGGAGDDIIRALMDEIDQRNREAPMIIEHVPQKKSA